MLLGGIQRTSTLDFPGVLCCVVFTLGCDMDCFYCHNRALIDGSGPPVPQAQVLDFLTRRRGLLDGVVVSGGEPTLQDDLPDFLARVRGLGYRTKLDTNGGRPLAVAPLLEQALVDYVALDIKAAPEDYPSVAAASWAPVAQTAGLLAAGGVAWEVRTTLYPGLDLDGLAEILGSLPPQPRWRLNFFRMPQRFREGDAGRLGLPALTPAAVAAAAERLKALQPNLMW